MNALEEKLRSGLTELADEASVNVRADDLVGTLTLLDRQHRNRRLLAGVAAATLAGVVGWAALTPHTITVSPAVPAAAPSSIGQLTSQYFRFQIQNPQTVNYIVGVDLRSDGSRLFVNTTSELEYGGDRQTGELSGPVGSYFSGKLPGNLFVVIIPDLVTDYASDLGDEGRHPTYLDGQLRTFTNEGFSMVVFRWEPSDGSAPHYFWLGSDGVVRDDSSTSMQTLALTVGDHQLRLFQRPGDSRWGTFPSDVIDVWRTVDPDRAEVRVMGFTGDMSVGRLPAGATDVKVVPRGDASWTVGRQADGRAWYMVRSNAEYTGSSSTDSLVKSISYTDADGKRVTYTPTLRH